MKTTAFLSFVLFMFLVGCSEKTVILTGYIPIGQKPVYNWHEKYPGSGSYDYESRITVFSDDGKTISARFYEVSFDGGYLVKFRDEYPPSIGKKVYVEMQLDDKDYFIRRASLSPYGEKK